MPVLAISDIRCWRSSLHLLLNIALFPSNTTLSISFTGNSHADTPEFEMHLDSLYKWSAVSIAERDSFVRSLYRYARKLLPANDPIRFKNYRSDLFEDLQMSAELAAKLQATDGSVYCYVSLWMEICIKVFRCAYRCKYTHSCMNIPPTDIKYNSAKLQYSFEVIGIFGDILNKWREILLFAVVIRLIEGRFSSRPLLIQPLLIFDIFEPSGRDLDVATEYQALSAKEESDLETLMIKYEFAISNAEAFTEQLNRELSNLDAANVHAIMESERKVQSLMDMFDVRDSTVSLRFFTLVHSEKIRIILNPKK